MKTFCYFLTIIFTLFDLIRDVRAENAFIGSEAHVFDALGFKVTVAPRTASTHKLMPPATFEVSVSYQDIDAPNMGNWPFVNKAVITSLSHSPQYPAEFGPFTNVRGVNIKIAVSVVRGTQDSEVILDFLVDDLPKLKRKLEKEKRFYGQYRKSPPLVITKETAINTTGKTISGFRKGYEVYSNISLTMDTHKLLRFKITPTQFLFNLVIDSGIKSVLKSLERNSTKKIDYICQFCDETGSVQLKSGCRQISCCDNYVKAKICR